MRRENPIDSIPASVFAAVKPSSSTLQKSEAETTARNIMKVRKRLDRWDIDEKEYERERKKDGDWSSGELAYFRQVLPRIKNPKMCMAFSGKWGAAGKAYLDKLALDGQAKAPKKKAAAKKKTAKKKAASRKKAK